MKTEPKPGLPEGSKRGESLTDVLGKSEQVKDMVEESAEELSSVNSTLVDELAKPHPLPGVEKALEQSEAVEPKVQAASEKLAVVNLALEEEVAGRDLLEGHLAVLTEREEIAGEPSLRCPQPRRNDKRCSPPRSPTASRCTSDGGYGGSTDGLDVRPAPWL